MFAILVSPENLPKIHEHQDTLDAAVAHFYDVVYLKSNTNWYYIRGWVGDRGQRSDWAVIPEYILKKEYDYDPDKIQTDWDIVVRK